MSTYEKLTETIYELMCRRIHITSITLGNKEWEDIIYILEYNGYTLKVDKNKLIKQSSLHGIPVFLNQEKDHSVLYEIEMLKVDKYV